MHAPGGEAGRLRPARKAWRWTSPQTRPRRRPTAPPASGWSTTAGAGRPVSDRRRSWFAGDPTDPQKPRRPSQTGCWARCRPRTSLRWRKTPSMVKLHVRHQNVAALLRLRLGGTMDMEHLVGVARANDIEPGLAGQAFKARHERGASRSVHLALGES